jgi:hypothetical protein
MNLLEMYIKYTKEHEAQEIFHKWAIIFATSSILSGRCWTTLGYGIVKPNLFVAFIGPPAARKSAAIEVIEDVMSPLILQDEITIASDSFSHRQIMEEFVKSEKSITVNDAAFNYMSLILMCDEIKTFLDPGEKKINNFLLTAFDGGKRKHSTMNCGIAETKNISLSILTAATPSFLRGQIFDIYVGIGLASRFIFLPVKEKRFHNPDGIFPTKLKEHIQRKLFSLLNIIGQIPFDETGKETYNAWYCKQPLGVDRTIPIAMIPYGGRRQTYLRKLSLTVWAWDYLENPTIDKKISKRHVEQALILLKELESYVREAYGAVGRSADVDNLKDMEDFFRERKGEWIKRKDIFKMFKRDIQPTKIEELLNMMVKETKDVKAEVKKDNLMGAEVYKYVGD